MKLQPGDEIRVIAPSQSWDERRRADYLRAQKLLEKAGFKVTFGKNVRNRALQHTAAAEDRAADVNEAFADRKVKLIMALRGGWSCNDILPLIDWAVVRANPKPVIGFSDITVLLNAILTQAGGVTFLGPTLSPFSDRRFGQMMLDDLLAVLSGESVTLVPYREWGLPKQKLRLKARPLQVLQSGRAKGVLRGGNIGTFYLGQGTPYIPPFDRPYILAIEDDDEAGEYTAREFSRRLESILQQPGARMYLQGILIGRFLPNSKIKPGEIAAVVASKKLGDIPVISELSFGHSLPNVTLPLGGRATIETRGKHAIVTVQAVTI